VAYVSEHRDIVMSRPGALLSTLQRHGGHLLVIKRRVFREMSTPDDVMSRPREFDPISGPHTWISYTEIISPDTP